MNMWKNNMHQPMAQPSVKWSSFYSGDRVVGTWPTRRTGHWSLSGRAKSSAATDDDFRNIYLPRSLHRRDCGKGWWPRLDGAKDSALIAVSELTTCHIHCSLLATCCCSPATEQLIRPRSRASVDGRAYPNPIRRDGAQLPRDPGSRFCRSGRAISPTPYER